MHYSELTPNNEEDNHNGLHQIFYHQERRNHR